MSHRDDDPTKASTQSQPQPQPVSATPPVKKLRFRGDLNMHHFTNARVEDLFDEPDGPNRRGLGIQQRNANVQHSEMSDEAAAAKSSNESRSFFDFLKIELTRGYVLEHDEERYSARRQKIYTFMRIPRELEKFMAYGVLQCVDSFLYIHTFLPIRYVMAVWAVTWRTLATCVGWRRRGQRLLSPAEICDILKGSIWIIATLLILSVDTNRMYHIIKSQSVIKLYIFYNMLEVGDRLLSAFGQDTIDALFWTATEPKERSRAASHFGVVTHILFALTYIILHSGLIMLQATALNVAINSNNKGLLAIMMSNNFVELKGSVFKKFDKNNLFQLTCSDVRERVHLTVLLFVVVIQTMKEFNWRAEQFYVLLPDCCYVLMVEVCIDWLKHAFITRFNELPADVYKEYTISLAYDMTQTRQKHAFSDHSDLVSRRMGFIPYPLGIVLIKALYTAISFDSFAAVVLFVVAYVTLMTCRILNTICALGKACDLMRTHQEEKHQLAVAAHAQQTPQGAERAFGIGINGIGLLPSGGPTPAKTSTAANAVAAASRSSGIGNTTTSDASSSPMHTFVPLQRSKTVDITPSANGAARLDYMGGGNTPRSAASAANSMQLLMPDPNLGATALFSNSDVDLEDICLNEKLLNTNCSDEVFEHDPQSLTRSVPDLQQESSSPVGTTSSAAGGSTSLGGGEGGCGGVGSGGNGDGGDDPRYGNAGDMFVRTHKRSESEPSIQSSHIEEASLAAASADRS